MARPRTNPFWDRLDQIKAKLDPDLSKAIHGSFPADHKAQSASQLTNPNYWVWQFLRRNPSFQKLWLDSEGQPFETFYDGFLAFDLELNFDRSKSIEQINAEWRDLLDPRNIVCDELSWEKADPYVIYPSFITAMEGTWDEEASSWKNHTLLSRFYQASLDDVDVLADVEKEVKGSKRLTPEQKQVALRQFKDLVGDTLTSEPRTEDVQAHEMAIVLDFNRPDLSNVLLELSKQVAQVQGALGLPSCNFRKLESDVFFDNLRIFDALVMNKTHHEACLAGDYNVEQFEASGKLVQKFDAKNTNRGFLDFLEAPTLLLERLTKKEEDVKMTFQDDEIP